MLRSAEGPSIALPEGWPRFVRSAVVHTVSMARTAFTVAHTHAEHHAHPRARLQARNDWLEREVALLTEELRIKDARMEKLTAQRRPHYPPAERLAILELRAARGWSLAQASRRMLVTPLTISSWTQRLDDEGPDALVRLPEPVNRFSDLVGYIVRRLKALCPKMGTRRIARVLARASLHLGATTVRRMLTARPKPKRTSQRPSPLRIVTAERPNHVCIWTSRSSPRWAASGSRGFRACFRSDGRSAGGSRSPSITTPAGRWASRGSRRSRRPMRCGASSTAPAAGPATGRST